ncbi:hypothetical protein [Mangrovicoccus sp. HB161399]|uniref:hypothetical protein n=1 Tax=Mangrovicoccus sp. HB161399 TaxID=2720392 RepID=UPI001557D15E|nr:hypothetical protein [Mangrovicoccus sp. HB161399]
MSEQLNELAEKADALEAKRFTAEDIDVSDGAIAGQAAFDPPSGLASESYDSLGLAQDAETAVPPPFRDLNLNSSGLMPDAPVGSGAATGPLLTGAVYEQQASFAGPAAPAGEPAPLEPDGSQAVAQPADPRLQAPAPDGSSGFGPAMPDLGSPGVADAERPGGNLPGDPPLADGLPADPGPAVAGPEEIPQEPTTFESPDQVADTLPEDPGLPGGRELPSAEVTGPAWDLLPGDVPPGSGDPESNPVADPAAVEPGDLDLSLSGGDLADPADENLAADLGGLDLEVPLDPAEALLGDIDLSLGGGDLADPADGDLAADLGGLDLEVPLDPAEALLGDIDLSLGGGDLADPADGDLAADLGGLDLEVPLDPVEAIVGDIDLSLSEEGLGIDLGLLSGSSESGTDSILAETDGGFLSSDLAGDALDGLTGTAGGGDVPLDGLTSGIDAVISGGSADGGGSLVGKIGGFGLF